MRRGRRGNSFVETAMFLPVLLLLLVGMVQFGKITLTYFALKKTLYAAATYLASQRSVNFCDESDTGIETAKSFAVTGTSDSSAPAAIANLTTDMIQVRIECVDPSTQTVGECATSGCEGPAGGPRPDFIVVSIPDGYPVQPRIPFMLMDAIPLKPEVRVPFGGI